MFYELMNLPQGLTHLLLRIQGGDAGQAASKEIFESSKKG